MIKQDNLPSTKHVYQLSVTWAYIISRWSC